VRICQVTLASSDPAAQAAFWGTKLGLPIAKTEAGVEVGLRDSSILFEPAPTGLDARYHFAVNVPRGRIEDAAAWVAERHELLAFHGDPDAEEGARRGQVARRPVRILTVAELS
jgi:catechol 2,3-dioxygenase-like lactoylglutathione lyase family enzyme